MHPPMIDGLLLLDSVCELDGVDEKNSAGAFVGTPLGVKLGSTVGSELGIAVGSTLGNGLRPAVGDSLTCQMLHRATYRH